MRKETEKGVKQPAVAAPWARLAAKEEAWGPWSTEPTGPQSNSKGLIRPLLRFTYACLAAPSDFLA